MSILGRIRTVFSWLRRVVLPRLPFPLLVLAAILFRLPAIENAGAQHSDATIVGLQAMHILHGEVAWYLWGTTYQASVEPFLLAPFIAVFGPRPIVLLGFALLGHLIVMWITYAILRRHIGVARAFLCTLILALPTWPAMSPSIYPPRMWSVVCFFIGLYLLDGAARSRRPLLRYAIGAALPLAAVYLDVYSAQMVPAALAFAVLTVVDRARGPSRPWMRTAALITGFGAMTLILIWLRRKTAAAPSTIGAEFVANNFPHLWNETLPSLLGYKFYEQSPHLGDNGWTPPRWYFWIEAASAASVLIAYVVANFSFAAKKIPWPVRRIGLFGLIMALSTLGGYLVYFHIKDPQTMRYLAPITWTLPFALAPLAWFLRPRTLAIFIAPYLVCAVVGGWLTYGQWVKGPYIVQTARGRADDERWLGEALRLRGIHYAAANYWMSYRLTFLWNENPIVVPFPGPEQRYAPYRDAYDAAPRIAYIFHPSATLSKVADYEKELNDQQLPYQEELIAGFTVITFDRKK